VRTANSKGSGGILSLASSVSSATTRSRSAVLDGVDESIDDLCLVRGSWECHAIATVWALQANAGPLERAVDRRWRSESSISRPRSPRSQGDRPQDQRCSAAGSAMLEAATNRARWNPARRNEPPDPARRHRSRRPDRARATRLVRRGRAGERRSEATAVVTFGRREESGDSSGTGWCDAVQPGPKRTPVKRSVLAMPTTKSRGVSPRVLERSEDPVAVHMELPAVGVGELGEASLSPDWPGPAPNRSSIPPPFHVRPHGVVTPSVSQIHRSVGCAPGVSNCHGTHRQETHDDRVSPLHSPPRIGDGFRFPHASGRPSRPKRRATSSPTRSYGAGAPLPS